MYSFLTVLNNSSQVLSISCDNEPLISNILPNEQSKPLRLMYGSVRIIAQNVKAKVVFDIRLPIKKETSHTLSLWDTSFDFK